MWILLFSYRMNALLSGYWQVLSFSFIHSIFSGSKRIKPQRSQTKMNSLLSSFGSLSPYISTLPSDIFLFLSLSTHPTPIALALPSGRADRREGWVALPAAVSVNLGPFYCSHSHSPSLSRSLSSLSCFSSVPLLCRHTPSSLSVYPSLSQFIVSLSLTSTLPISLPFNPHSSQPSPFSSSADDITTARPGTGTSRLPSSPFSSSSFFVPRHNPTQQDCVPETRLFWRVRNPGES